MRVKSRRVYYLPVPQMFGARRTELQPRRLRSPELIAFQPRSVIDRPIATGRSGAIPSRTLRGRAI
jgi:hypothetical protein